MDITIKDVPEGAEERVKSMAMRAIERFKSSVLTVSDEIRAQYESEMDTILVANDMPKKYAREEVKVEKAEKKVKVVEEPAVVEE